MNYDDMMAMACSAIEDMGASLIETDEEEEVRSSIKLGNRIIEGYDSIATSSMIDKCNHGYVYDGHYYKDGYKYTKCFYLCVENCAVDYDGWVYCKAMIPVPDVNVNVSEIVEFIDSNDISITFMDTDFCEDFKKTEYKVDEDIINRVKELDLGDSIIFDVKPGDEVILSDDESE